MPLNSKDKQILEHIHRYCNEVKLALQTFGYDKNGFLKNPVFQNACSMPIAQIGELAKRLTDDVIEKYPQVPWKNIKGMRDIFVHDYHSMNKNIIWETATEHVPSLSKNCEYILLSNGISIPQYGTKEQDNTPTR